MGSLTEMREAIRASGLRATPARLQVLKEMHAASGPLTHGEVCDRLGEGVDKVTVYRNLVDLADVGILRRLVVGTTFRFEASDAHRGAASAHFLCDDCGEVQCLPEFPLTSHRGLNVPQSVRLGEVEVHVRGRCDRCREATA